MADTSSGPRRKPGAAREKRSNARLAAVQALYQIDLTGGNANAVVREFAEHRIGPEEAQEVPDSVDGPMFAGIVRGVAARRAEIDDLLGRALTPAWPLERLERILRCLLQAATYEFLDRPDVPVRVVINEYLEIAHAFFSGPETKLANGVLDRLAHDLRPHEWTDAGRA
ncbi:transcription antitermination factor NusB [Zavarzinia sp. CC-PAN008]|uniref:transcription antitermination factor NusB n=1 Tax=Zavarzinia sp. CC-PAN008 TaxID=3243332 RepID=UPI003F7432E6